MPLSFPRKIDVGTLDWPQARQLLNEYLRDVQRFLEVTRIELVTLVTRGDVSLPQSVDLGRTMPPAGVLIVRAYRTDSPTTSLTVGALPSWGWNNNQLVLRSFSGLSAVFDYSLTLAILG